MKRKNAQKRSGKPGGSSAGSKPQKVTAVVVRQPSRAEQVARLREQERIIDDGMRTYIEVGRALRKVRDEKLFVVEGDASFVEYLKRRYNWEKSYGNAIINASVVTERLSAIVDEDQLPACEGQVRPLVSLEPDEATTVWKKAIGECKKSKTPITAARVTELAAKMYPKPTKTKSARRRADRRGDLAQTVTVNELSNLDDAGLRKRIGGKTISLLILNGKETDSANLIPRLAPFLSEKAVIAALVRWDTEDVILDAIDAAALTVQGRVMLYDDGNHSRKHPAQPGSAHRALWIASAAKRTKLELPDPLDARGKLDAEGALPDDVLEVIVKHLARQKEVVFVSHDPHRAAGLICNRIGRVALRIDEETKESTKAVKKAA